MFRLPAKFIRFLSFSFPIYNDLQWKVICCQIWTGIYLLEQTSDNLIIREIEILQLYNLELHNDVFIREHLFQMPFVLGALTHSLSLYLSAMQLSVFCDKITLYFAN